MAGVPGDPEVGFPEGSLPTAGLPGVRPKGGAGSIPASSQAFPAAGEQLALI
jgi:hypothetical protein